MNLARVFVSLKSLLVSCRGSCGLLKPSGGIYESTKLLVFNKLVLWAFTDNHVAISTQFYGPRYYETNADE